MEASKKPLVVGAVVAFTLVVIFIGFLLAVSLLSEKTIGSYTVQPEQVDEQPFEKDVADAIAMNDDLSIYAKNLLSGGPPPDGIAPIDDPKFVSVADADLFLTPEDQVFIVTVGEETKIYPQQILVWHEVVNEGDLAITYSPLTGSAIAFKADLGTSGMLLNSNSVYYDRKTESLWPQLLGKAIAGDRRGEKLETVPLVWASWENAKSVYPEAMILSRETGFDKSYGFDPYGSYADDASYYQTGKPFFPLMNDDDRLDDKAVVVGLRNETDELIAIPKSKIQEEKVVEIRNYVFFWDDELGAAFGYSESLGELQFTYKDGLFTAPDGGEWNGRGEATSDDDCCLLPVPLIESMWFAWAAFYPETEITE